MGFTLQGANGITQFSTAQDSAGRTIGRYMTVQTGVALDFFQKVSILSTDLTNNSYGLFSFRNAKGKSKVRFASLNAPRHLLSSRKSGCGWNPKGKITMNTNEISLCPVEYNGEQCPDEFYGECLEAIFESGDYRDFFSTKEGIEMFGEMIRLIYIGLGNSFYDLVWFGQHPLIDAADQNESYSAAPDEWEDYVDQQAACGGIITMIDAKKEEGIANFNVSIEKSEISSDGTEFIGVASELFDRLIKAQSRPLTLAGRNMDKPVLLVDDRIFKAYETELSEKYAAIPDMFYYRMNGAFCEKAGCTQDIVEGVLKYKGYLVVSMPEWGQFDAITGTNTFRAILTARGNFGISYDVPTVSGSLSQFEGFGLTINQNMLPPDKGMIYMDTAFKLGAAILDTDYIVNASLSLVNA